MQSVRNSFKTIAERLGRLNQTARFVIVTAVVLGAVMTAVVVQQHRATERVDSESAAQVELGKSSLPLAAGEGAPPERVSFDSLLQGDNPFLSRSQSDRRWLIATMSMLSQSISSMNGIEQATVMIDEPKSQVGLGRANTRASASVTIVAHEPLTPDVIDAIAEMVAGAHANLPVEQVRIIDAVAGHVHRARTPEELIAARQLEAQSAVERNVRQKIAEALAYIPDLTVAVHAGNRDGVSNAVQINATIGVPRSYFTHLYHEAHNDMAALPTHPELEPFITAETARIRSQIEPLLTLRADNASTGAVVVTMIPDVMHLAARDDAVVAPGEESVLAMEMTAIASWRQLGMYLIGIVGMFAIVLLMRRATKPQDQQSHDVRSPASEPVHSAHRPAPRVRTANSVPFSSLHLSDTRDTLVLIQDEEPRTIALIVYNLPHHKAAAILAGLPREKQIEVAKRVANMRKPNTELIREVEHKLASRLAEQQYEAAAV